MVKKLLKIFSVLLIVALIIAGFFFYSIYVSVGRLNIDYQTLSSDKIPADMDDVSIAFFSDIHYGTFMNEERLTTMIDKINNVHPDILVFAGDIFDHPELNMPNEETIMKMTEFFSSLEAPLGKFAVLGEQDEINDDVKAMIQNMMYQSNFELITNASVRLRNQSNSSITLVGVDSMVNGTIDISSAFQNVNAEEYNILVTHCPDLATSNELPQASIDIMVAGHSHGGQVYLPLLGPLSAVEGATTYNHGSYTINNMKLIVTNGLGTTNMDMRLFAPPQVTFFRLNSTAIVETPETSETP